jgi:hypothetical protein
MDRVDCLPVLDRYDVMHQIEPLLLHRRPLNVDYHVHAQNLKIGKPNNFKVFGINVFKQKQTNKKLKQKETHKKQQTTKNQKQSLASSFV